MRVYLLAVGGATHPGCELDLCGCQPFAVLLREVCGSGNGPLDPNHGASTRRLRGMYALSTRIGETIVSKKLPREGGRSPAEGFASSLDAAACAFGARPLLSSKARYSI